LGSYPERLFILKDNLLLKFPVKPQAFLNFLQNKGPHFRRQTAEHFKERLFIIVLSAIIQSYS